MDDSINCQDMLSSSSSIDKGEAPVEIMVVILRSGTEACDFAQKMASFVCRRYEFSAVDSKVHLGW